ncbi:GIY-YIG nuclease family protein [Parasphingorhabdus sp.]|uniref:GIY-YIG nuclease family protein n=1 Tax=Parasphingorhabdus sp. TaxID=2709688 RepID=UPI003A928D68
MAFWTYMLLCADGKFYTGHTDDLERRIAEHDSGGYCKFTSQRRPVELVWSETFPTRAEALAAELSVKKWSQAKKRALVAGDWKKLSYFAKPPKERLSTSLETNGENGGPEAVRTERKTVRVERSRDTGITQ